MNTRSNDGLTRLEAELDPKTTNYIFWWVLFFFTVVVISIPLIPFMIIVYFAWYRPRYKDFHSLKLTEKSVEINRGVVFRSQTILPLDRITDVSINQGPLMRRYGIYGITVETAGQTQTQGAANMVGVMNPYAFRDAVMKNVELSKTASGSAEAGPASAQVTSQYRASTDVTVSDQSLELLAEIRDILQRMEQKR